MVAYRTAALLKLPLTATGSYNAIHSQFFLTKPETRSLYDLARVTFSTRDGNPIRMKAPTIANSVLGNFDVANLFVFNTGKLHTLCDFERTSLPGQTGILIECEIGLCCGDGNGIATA